MHVRKADYGSYAVYDECMVVRIEGHHQRRVVVTPFDSSVAPRQKHPSEPGQYLVWAADLELLDRWRSRSPSRRSWLARKLEETDLVNAQLVALEEDVLAD